MPTVGHLLFIVLCGDAPARVSNGQQYLYSLRTKVLPDGQCTEHLVLEVCVGLKFLSLASGKTKSIKRDPRRAANARFRRIPSN
jgi:hypothetical protein